MPNIIYTVAERTEMVELRLRGLTYQRICNHFETKYPNRPTPSVKSIRRNVERFRQTGNVDPGLVKVVQPKKRLSEEMKLAVCLKAEERPRKPTAVIAQELNISRSSVRRVLRTEKYKPCKRNIRQQHQNKDDEEQGVLFENVTDPLNVEGLDRICLRMSTVTLVVTPQKQNVELWSHADPHFTIDCNTQSSQTLHVWVGILCNRLIGPFFIDGKLDGEKYLKMLREQIVPALRDIEGDGPRIWFQQDGAPLYFTTSVQQFLDEQFPDCWIGKGSSAQCPAQSPELWPLDFPLLSYLKSRLHKKDQILNIPQLRKKIIEILEAMDSADINKTDHAFYDPFALCTADEGVYYKQLMQQCLDSKENDSD